MQVSLLQKLTPQRNEYYLKLSLDSFLWTIISVCFYQCLLPIRKSCETMEGKTDIFPFFLLLFIFFSVLCACVCARSSTRKTKSP